MRLPSGVVEDGHLAQAGDVPGWDGGRRAEAFGSLEGGVDVVDGEVDDDARWVGVAVAGLADAARDSAGGLGQGVVPRLLTFGVEGSKSKR
jgi:hypothetical protein